MADRIVSGGAPPALELEAPPTTVPSKGGPIVNPEAVNNVLYSDIGITVLLNRLKQSIASVKKRARLEEDHARGLEKLCKATNESIKKPEVRGGSYSLHLGGTLISQERMSNNGLQFATSLSQMHADLDKLAANMDLGRKHWKGEATTNEKRVKDAESALEKAKAKYDSLAEDYDKARTGGQGSGRVFTVKGPKSAEKYEEDLLRKLQAADADYASKVQTAKQSRQDNLTSLRPQAVKALQDLVRECDAGVVLQLQKYVSNGLEVNPIRAPDGSVTGRGVSMRETVAQIDNAADFHIFVSSHGNNVPPAPADIKYEKHPTLGPTQQMPQGTPPKRTSAQASPSVAQKSTFAGPIAVGSSPRISSQPPQIQPTTPQPPLKPQFDAQTSAQPPSQPRDSPQTSSFSGPKGPGQLQIVPDRGVHIPPQQYQPYTQPNGTYGGVDSGSGSLPGAPPFANSRQQGYSPQTNGGYGSPGSQLPQGPQNPQGSRPGSARPVFGQTLDALFQRDDTPVPLIVVQCIQAVDLFGLDVEGIYRQNGTLSQIAQLKQLFDTDSSRVDFRNPEAFFHDVNGVAGLLKQFLRELPDPLTTAEAYTEFMEAATIDDPNARRDAVHSIINGLPDANYATLRTLILHLHRVQEHQENNRMTIHSLSICFAPALMGQQMGSPVTDGPLQARILDTILTNTYQIFDED